MYVVLLLASHIVRRGFQATERPSPDQQVAVLNATRDGQRKDTQIRMAYTDTGQESNQNLPVAVLLHGTPMASKSFDALVPELEQHLRVLNPDLPGFGGSTIRIPDFSIETHAEYVRQWLEALDIKRFHFIAYSQGGGVALEFYRLAPERVASMTLLSSIGVQELELFGDYYLNHAIYALQLMFFGVLQEGVPHFGLFDGALLSSAYARNFMDSDQRPLREILRQFEAPMLILHGHADKLVPLSAAREHHRLVPQSKLTTFDGGHGLLFYQADILAAHVLPFIAGVERGEATTRENSLMERRMSAAAPFDASQSPPFEGITRLVMLLLIALSTYVTEDLTCIAAGLMVARGLLAYIPATLACLVGIVSGDLLLYLLGRTMGQAVVRRRPMKWFISERALIRNREWFARRGPIVILLGRFLPGARLPTYVAAGVLNTPFWRCLLYFSVAGLIWTPLLTGAAFWLGDRALQLMGAYRVYGLPIAIGLAIVLWLIIKILLPMFTFKGRRLLLSSWRRLTRWEFWPPWVFYPPVVVYALILGLKHRCLTVFTAANPAMPAGGFIGESKSDILKGLAAAGEYLARSRLIPAGSNASRPAQVREFMDEHGLSLPVVLKPDSGERGKGVKIAHTESDVVDYFERHDAVTLVQEYAPGKEFGVFYYRLPTEKRGHIFAITDKHFPTVVGDGKHTLEQLILKNDRAVCMAPLFMTRHADRLYDIPALGHEIPLVEVGTHCLGAEFRDGDWVRTPELEATIDKISRHYDGFFFGRYDVRTPCVADFRKGTNFKIVELNGVTSEATNIYDPTNSLISAYKTIMRQWYYAFEIGAQNRKLGVRPTPTRELVGILEAACVDTTGKA